MRENYAVTQQVKENCVVNIEEANLDKKAEVKFH